jgi:PAS domain S-box-containing protein
MTLRPKATAETVLAPELADAIIRIIMDSSPSGFIVSNTDDTIVAANRRLLPMFGIEPAALFGKPLDRFVEQAARCAEWPDVLCARIEALRKDASQVHQQVTDAHGLYRQAVMLARPASRMVTIHALPLHSGLEKVGLLWMFGDVTPFVEADEQLRVLVDASPVPLFIAELETGELLLENDKLLRTLGISSRDGVSIYAQLFEPTLVDDVRHRLENGETIDGHEVSLTNDADGQTRWVLVSMTVDSLRGQPMVIGGLSDITLRKRAEEDLRRTYRELQQTQAQLVQSEKMASLGMLVAGVAHEINQPLGALQSTLETLERAIERLIDAEKQSSRERLGRTISAATHVMSEGRARISAIVSRLIDFAGLDQAERKPTDINARIENTVGLLRPMLGARPRKNAGCKALSIELELESLPKLMGYPARLQQALLNILLNAAEAISETAETADKKGIIVVSTTAVDHEVVITVADNGCGIEKAHLDRVFDPGFTTKGVGVGVGLGLAIAYQAIAAHDGALEVDSEPNVGTTVTIRLPRKNTNT